MSKHTPFKQRTAAPRGLLFRLACIVVCMINLVGCKDVMFLHKVVAIVGGSVDATPFIGSWTVSGVAGVPPTEPIGVEIRTEDGDLRALISQGGLLVDKSLTLTQLGTALVLSIELGPGSQAQFTVALENGDTQMSLNGPDPELFKLEIENGAMPGQIQRIDDLSELVVVEMSGEELALAIEQNLALFAGPSYVLTKE